MPDLCVVGLGYIGLPTATVFAEAGLSVVGVDVNPQVVKAINEGRPHISEPGLVDALAAVTKNDLLTAATEPVPASAFIIAVPTPFGPGREPDLSYVMAATDAIAPVLRPGNLVVLESTSPIGATELVADRIRQARADLDVPTRGTETSGQPLAIAYCPERVLPGQIMREMRENDRILGGLTEPCAERASEFYERVVVGECHRTDARTAELVKLSENSFRDVNIAFANELSMIAAEHDIDAEAVIELANRHPRVEILQPGPGVGGHCIAVDPWFIVSSSPERSQLIRTAREVNLAKTEWVCDQVDQALGSKPGVVACLGLAYKPNIDDLRESPAVQIAQRLVEQNHQVLVVEPHISELPASLAGAELVSVDLATSRADVIAVLVAHSAFKDHVGTLDQFARPIVDTVGLTRHR